LDKFIVSTNITKKKFPKIFFVFRQNCKKNL
jgi:hypothetical protein